MIVVTAPTGNIGGELLNRLLAGGEAIRIIARDPSKLAANVRNRVEVFQGSHSERDVVMAAFAGADAVFWLVPSDAGALSAEAAYVAFSRPACEALRECGVRHVVGISALGRGWPRNAGHVTATLKADDLIAETGVAYRALACGSLMENVLRQTAPIRDQAAFYWPAPADLEGTAVASGDVAAMAATLLASRSWSGVESIPLKGPELLSFGQMCRIMSEVLGKPIAFHEMSMADMKAMMIGRGGSEAMAQAMVDMLTAKNEGLDDLIAGPTPGATPTTFRAWCEAVLQPAIAGRSTD